MTTAIPELATFPRGIHPPENKHLAENAAIEVLPTPAEVAIPVLQHLGAPCAVSVKPRTDVALGDVVGTATGPVSAPIHASVTGKTGRETPVTLPNGRHVMAVTIAAAAEQPLAGRALFDEIFGGEWPRDGLAKYTPQQIIEAVKAAGLVGLGGAAFPTHIKLQRNEKKPVSTLLINGCECEPYLTADYRLMVEAAGPIITGALLARQAAGAAEAVLCVEDNKPQAIAALKQAATGTDLRLCILKTKYPQGGEKQLVVAVLGKAVPTGGLPLDVGALVMNVGTAAALARAVVRGKPLTHRIVTVAGAGIKTPKNLLVPIGTSYRTLIDYCGGLTGPGCRVVAGGPMMGFTIGDLETPVTKGTSGLSILTADEVQRTAETPCLRCGRCVDVCPLNLVPTRLALAARYSNVGVAVRYHIAACMECGCCAYACPARVPLVQLIRAGKIMVRNAAPK